MELAEPSIATAFDACVAQGATTVVVAPWFLGPGRHWDRDIPELTAAAAARHPGVRHLVTAPLGPHPLLFAIVEERVRQCLAHATADAPECDLCAGTGPLPPGLSRSEPVRASPSQSEPIPGGASGSDGVRARCRPTLRRSTSDPGGLRDDQSRRADRSGRPDRRLRR